MLAVPGAPVPGVSSARRRWSRYRRSLTAVSLSQEPGLAAMAEESSSGSSGSPGAGDTLPWNLGKHQRSQRAKAAAGNGTVLDPAERAVIRIAGTVRGTGTCPGGRDVTGEPGRDWRARL